MMFTPLILGLGGQELLVILLIFLLLFGGSKIPELMKGLGKGVPDDANTKKEEQQKE